VNLYRYLDPENMGVIQIKASRRPSVETRPRMGTWIVNEWTNEGWKMPPFPEVTWGTLSKLVYLGSEKLIPKE
jgi:hypothetical protein